MSFADFHFAEPRWLWLAAVAPVLLALLQRHAAHARREQLARMASPHFVGQLTASHSPARRTFKNVLLLAAVALAGLALARPQWGRIEAGNAWLGEDVVFVLDCSLSMTTSDVLPSRMQRAKFAMLDFVRKQSHGRVGLVAFAGSAFIQCPLTFDADAFEETVSFNLRPGFSLGQAAQQVDDTIREMRMPATIGASFQCTVKEFQSSFANLSILLGIAILVIYIVLGVLYEIFIHPITILSGLPSAVFGALEDFSQGSRSLRVRGHHHVIRRGEEERHHDDRFRRRLAEAGAQRSEEHTSELQ